MVIYSAMYIKGEGELDEQVYKIVEFHIGKRMSMAKYSRATYPF
jgi:hypothetical protein